jgi:hypothetical protein
MFMVEELDGSVFNALRRALVEVKQCSLVIGWVTKFIILSSSVLRKARSGVGYGCICEH